MSKDKRCVFVADTQAAAQGTALWLESQGIEIHLVDKTTLGFSHGVSFASNDPAADGWQIWVKDLTQVELARELLHEREEAKRQKSELGTIEATCEECGATQSFDGRFRGTIQNCPQCGRYLDVPGADDPYEWPEDFEQSE